MQCHQRIRCQKPGLTAHDLCCKQPSAGLPTFVVWRTYWRSLWLTEGTVGKVPKRRVQNESRCKTLYSYYQPTEYSPCGESSTSSARQKFPHFMEPQNSLPSSHQLHTCPVVRHFNPIHPLSPHFYHPNESLKMAQHHSKKTVNNHPITQHELRCTSTLSSTSSLNWVGGQRHAQGALCPGNRPGTNCTWGLVGPKTGLDWCGLSPPPVFDPRTVQPKHRSTTSVIAFKTNKATRNNALGYSDCCCVN
jgi:hypothetical protein